MVLEFEHSSVVYARVDAIVSAANVRLSPAGGLAKTIEDLAGPALKTACRRQQELAIGSAVATTAGRLPARWVIHAVGPRWAGGTFGEANLLAAAYRSAVEVAIDIGARSVALPSLSTGVFGYPVEMAAPIAVRSVRDASIDAAGQLDVIRFCLYGPDEYAAFLEANAALS